MALFQKYDTLNLIRFTPDKVNLNKSIIGNYKEVIQEVFMKPFDQYDICRYVLMNDKRDKYFGWVRLYWEKEGTTHYCLQFHLNTNALTDEQIEAVIALICRSAMFRFIGKGDNKELYITSNHVSGIGPKLEAAAKKVGFKDDWDGVLTCYSPRLNSLDTFKRKEINDRVTEYKIPIPKKK